MKIFKKIKNKLDAFFYSVTPRMHDSASFANHDPDKDQWYDEYLDYKRSIMSSDPLFRIASVLCVLLVLFVFGLIVVALIATTFF